MSTDNLGKACGVIVRYYKIYKIAITPTHSLPPSASLRGTREERSSALKDVICT
jgi:hypothetical protein